MVCTSSKNVRYERGYAYALGSSSAYAMSSTECSDVRAKGFKINKGFPGQSDFDGLLPTK